jgi:hypothetical protein
MGDWKRFQLQALAGPEQQRRATKHASDEMLKIWRLMVLLHRSYTILAS